MNTAEEKQAHNEAQAPLVVREIREPEIQPQPESTSLLAVISRAASDPACDVDKMRALLDMRRDLERDAAEREFNDALNHVAEQVKPIARDASNPQTSSKYASYHALDKALRPIYVPHGFAVSFDTEDAPELFVKVVGFLSHRAGHTKKFSVLMPADGKGAKGGDVMTKTHAVGAAISYGKRYLCGMMFNIASGNDDDGNAASPSFISQAQVQELSDLADELGVDKPAFCGFFQIDSLADIPKSAFAKAKTAMQAKRKKRVDQEPAMKAEAEALK